MLLDLYTKKRTLLKTQPAEDLLDPSARQRADARPQPRLLIVLHDYVRMPVTRSGAAPVVWRDPEEVATVDRAGQGGVRQVGVMAARLSDARSRARLPTLLSISAHSPVPNFRAATIFETRGSAPAEESSFGLHLDGAHNHIERVARCDLHAGGVH